jgi:catechol 2,3-dioxygenase-like lactoylglutathione lyase family enzyme
MPKLSRTIGVIFSSRTTRGICFFLSLFAFSPFNATSQTKRPRIIGIGSVTIYVKNAQDAADFYSKGIGYRNDRNNACLSAPHTCLAVDDGQRLDVVSPSSPTDNSYLGEITFRTDDVTKLRDYLNSLNIKTSEIAKTIADQKYDVLHFSVMDPENHPIGFVAYEGCSVCEGDSNQGVSRHVIHAGFIVRDREKMEHFYKDILGFRPYWHGGMKDDETTWVSLQVPDGTDWLEFMLYDPTGKDKHFLGVMNHIALGVTDIQAAKAQLVKNGVKLTEEPKLGRDGKWQLNVYDPDETRVEFMEFTPKEKPCCSEFTAPHPKP